MNNKSAMLVSSIFLAINQVLTKHLLTSQDYWTIFAYIWLAAFLSLIPVYYIHLPDFKSSVEKFGTKVIGVISLNETITIGGVLAITLAASTGYITLVNSLSSVQPFFVLLIMVLLSIFMLRIMKEEIGNSCLFWKCFSILLIVVGAVLIT